MERAHIVDYPSREIFYLEVGDIFFTVDNGCDDITFIASEDAIEYSKAHPLTTVRINEVIEIWDDTSYRCISKMF